MLYPRSCAFVALLCAAVFLALPAVAAGPAANLAAITELAAKAYLWGLGPEYIERFSKPAFAG